MTSSIPRSAKDTDTLTPRGDLSVASVGSVVDNGIIPGTQYTYTVTISNAGPSDVTGANSPTPSRLSSP